MASLLLSLIAKMRNVCPAGSTPPVQVCPHPSTFAHKSKHVTIVAVRSAPAGARDPATAATKWGSEMGLMNGFGGRSVNVRILRELAKFGAQPVTASELASRLSSPPRSIAPALQGLVKAGLAQRHWGDSRSPRMYVVTDAGREYVARARDAVGPSRM